MTEYANTINLPVAGSPRFEQDTTMAIARLRASLGPAGTPTFSTLALIGLTANHLVSTDANTAFASVANLASWIAGTANEIDITNDGDGTITVGLVNPLIAGKGGTGAATLTDHGILLGSGTDAITPLGVATNGQLPIGSTGADPVLAALIGTANRITVANGAGTITLSGPQDIHTGASPTFAGLTVGALTGVLKATAGVVAGSAVHTDLGSIGANDHHNQAHAIDGADHTAAGLTIGHVLQATGATTFGFAVVPGLHDATTVAAAPLTLSGQALTFNYDTNDFQLSGNNLQVKDGGIAHDSTSGVHQAVGTTASPRFATLGIGTTDPPTEKIEVAGAGGVGVLVNCTNDNNTYFKFSTNGVLRGIMQSNSLGTLFGTVTSLPFEIYTNNLSRMYIQNDGKVGVNKTPIAEQFEVNGKIRADTAFNVNGTDGLASQVVALAKLTPGGADGSITITGGIVTAYTAPT